MNKIFKRMLNIIIVLIIIYLMFSSIYTILKIDFDYHLGPAQTMRYDETTTMFRSFMGIHKVHIDNIKLPPVYFVDIIIKIIIAIILLFIFFFKINKTIKKKWLVISIILVLIITASAIGINIYQKNVQTDSNSNEENIQIEEDIYGEYTGYQLTLAIRNSSNNNVIVKKYNISNNATFYEPIGGGEWKVNLDEEKIANGQIQTYYKILRINSIEEDSISIEYGNANIVFIVKYDEELEINSISPMTGQTVYSYRISIAKVENTIDEQDEEELEAIEILETWIAYQAFVDSSNDNLEEIQNQLENIEHVYSVKLVTNEESLDNMRNGMFGNYLDELLSEDENPFLNSFIITVDLNDLDDLEYIKTLGDRISNIEGISKVEYSNEIIDVYEELGIEGLREYNNILNTMNEQGVDGVNSYLNKNPKVRILLKDFIHF